jgi:hypothetical protein
MHVKCWLLLALLAVLFTSWVFTPPKIKGASPRLAEITQNLLVEQRQVEAKRLPFERLVQVATERNRLIREMMVSNPQEVLLYHLSNQVRNSFPHEIHHLLEEEVVFTGELEWQHADNFDTFTSVDEYIFHHLGQTYRLKLMVPPHIPLGITRAKINGLKVSETILVDNRIEESLEVFEPVVVFNDISSSNTTVHKAYVVLANFADDTSQPFTKEQAWQMMFGSGQSVKEFYLENSFGKVDFVGKFQQSGDVFGWYTIPYKKADGCITGIIADQAKQAMINDGISLDGYRLGILITPTNSTCGYSGKASNPAHLNGTLSLFTASHEIGHLFAQGHGDLLKCVVNGVPVPIGYDGSACTSTNYGDPFSVMGSGRYHHNNQHKYQMKYYDEKNVLTIDRNQPGIYTITPANMPSDGLQVLRVPRGYDGFYYYLEFRQPYGFDTFKYYQPVVNGITIRLSGFPGKYSNYASFLIDTTPDSVLGASDAPLRLGGTMNDPDYGITFTTMEVSTTAATVKVDFSEPVCTPKTPSLQLSPLSQWAYPGQSLYYYLTLKNNDLLTCEPVTFVMKPGLLTGFIQNPEVISMTVNPGKTTTFKFMLTASSMLEPGTYPFTYKTTHPMDTSLHAQVSGSFNLSLPSKIDYDGDGNLDYIDYRLLFSNVSATSCPSKGTIPCPAQLADINRLIYQMYYRF